MLDEHLDEGMLIAAASQQMHNYGRVNLCQAKVLEQVLDDLISH
jgi:hypothetical protein